MAPDRLIELCGAPPLSAKLLSGASGPELVIVSSAASLLEGDELSIEVVLLPGARLTVTSAAAQMAFPCLHGGRTALGVRARPLARVPCWSGDLSRRSSAPAPITTPARR